ncbi:MAG: hypothetical protein LBQ12_10870 [Deltaproteobacteria bacterium]|nr:hypothetical protein [Deltaproteobacteria bacterium]
MEDLEDLKDLEGPEGPKAGAVGWTTGRALLADAGSERDGGAERKTERGLAKAEES